MFLYHVAKPSGRVVGVMTALLLSLSSLSVLAEIQNDDPHVASQDSRSALSIRPSVVPERLLVKFKDGTASASSTARSAWRIERQLSPQLHIVSVPGAYDAHSLQQKAEALSRLPEVEYAVPDAWRYPLLSPNDSEYYLQHYHYDVVSGLDSEMAWSLTTGSSAVTVAVIDTGVLYENSNLQGQLLPGYDFISDIFVANDGDGRDADASDPGDWAEANACGYTHPEFRSSWHGTAIASLIAAPGNDAQGMAGMAWQTQILPVRVLGRCGGFISDIIDGMRWAGGLNVEGVPENPNPAQIVNLSLGGFGVCSAAEQEVIDELTENDILVVTAAGNGFENAFRNTPGNCEQTLNVAAVGLKGGLSRFSNYGVNIDLAASGSSVLVASNRGLREPQLGAAGESYRRYDGTSFSAPLVSGVAALMLSLNSSLSVDEMKQVLLSSVRPFPQVNDANHCTTDNCGVGILSAGTAVNAVANARLGSVEIKDLVQNTPLNKLLAAAKPISQGVNINGELGGVREVDGYSFVHSGGGVTIESFGGVDTFAYLLDADGKLLLMSDNKRENDANFAMIVDDLPEGRYYLLVEEFNSVLRPTAGAYRLNITSAQALSVTSGNSLEELGGSGAFSALLMLLFVFGMRLWRANCLVHNR